MSTIAKAIKARQKAIQDLAENSAIENGSCYQAIDLLRGTLDRLSEHIDKMDYRAASGLGYKELSSNYIFLQRLLGSLSSVDLSITSLIQDIAHKTGENYETVEPHVMKQLVFEKNKPTEDGEQISDLVRQGLDDIKAGRTQSIDSLWDGIETESAQSPPPLSLIEINPDKRNGRACIKGTRIAVQDVLEWMLRGMSVDEILGDYPELTKAQLNACFRYTQQKFFAEE